jgi:16S rRNA (uracil1498-N3)-methyltransferase
MDFIVQKGTELGAVAIQPLVSERTIVKADPDDTGKQERWRDIALEACKQCVNNWLPEILPARHAKDLLSAPGQYDLKLIGSLQPDAQPLKSLLGATRPASVLVIIGPEGDFTPAELSLAKSASCLPLSLGPLVLRADTAALYAVSILHHEL